MDNYPSDCPNDLHKLDLLTMKWSVDPPPLYSWMRMQPCGRTFHTMTLISPTKIALFGGEDKRGANLGDCWLLNLGVARQGGEVTTMWTRCKYLCGDPCQDLCVHMRSEHAAGTCSLVTKFIVRFYLSISISMIIIVFNVMDDFVTMELLTALEPESKRLWIMGGMTQKDGNDKLNSEEIVVVSFDDQQEPTPLRLLTMEWIINNISENEKRLMELPRALTEEIESKRSWKDELLISKPMK